MGRKDIRSASKVVSDALNGFNGMVAEHSHDPRIRARLVQVIESRIDGNEAEVIEPFDGEAYIFVDERGIPALTVQMDNKYLIVEVKNTRGELVNGIVGSYDEKRDVGKHPDSEYAAPVDPKAQTMAWMIDLLKRYGSEEGVYRRVQAILTARENWQGEAFEKEMLGEAVAEVMGNQHTPPDLYNDLGDYLLDLHGKANIHDPKDPEYIRAYFTDALAQAKPEAAAE